MVAVEAAKDTAITRSLLLGVGPCAVNRRVIGMWVAWVAVNDDNAVIAKRFSGTRLNTRVYVSHSLIQYQSFHIITISRT